MNLTFIRTTLYRLFLLTSVSILALNVLLILYSVFTRYILNHSPIWSDELSRYGIIASVMLAMSCAYVESKHMKVAFIESAVNVSIKRLIRLYQWFIVLAVALFFSYISTQYALSLSKFSSMSLGISKTIPMLSVPIGFGALFFMVLLQGPFPKSKQGAASC
ncbi:TRAP transporter small permease [Marinomonas sp.]